MATDVRLADDEALVLFELLSSGKLAPAIDAAEAHALDVVLARLGEQLVTPFAEDYGDKLIAARKSLIDRYGDLP